MSHHGIVQGMVILALFLTVLLDAEVGVGMAAGTLIGHLMARSERREA